MVDWDYFCYTILLKSSRQKNACIFERFVYDNLRIESEMESTERCRFVAFIEQAGLPEEFAHVFKALPNCAVLPA